MNPKESVEEPKKEAAKSPGKDDIHEQRQPSQPREGIVSPSSSEAETPPRH